MFMKKTNNPFICHHFFRYETERWAAIHHDEDIKQHYPAINALDARADKFSYGYTMEMNYFMAII